jgi:hypothetical protein
MSIVPLNAERLQTLKNLWHLWKFTVSKSCLLHTWWWSVNVFEDCVKNVVTIDNSKGYVALHALKNVQICAFAAVTVLYTFSCCCASKSSMCNYQVIISHNVPSYYPTKGSHLEVLLTYSAASLVMLKNDRGNLLSDLITSRDLHSTSSIFHLPHTGSFMEDEVSGSAYVSNRTCW